MATYNVARIREQGVDLIIIEVASTFGFLSNADQARAAASFQTCATAAGLAGTAVLVWDAGSGRMGFWGPRPFHPYLQSLSLLDVGLMLNGTLTCA